MQRQRLKGADFLLSLVPEAKCSRFDGVIYRNPVAWVIIRINHQLTGTFKKLVAIRRQMPKLKCFAT
jgi:hypothetical protein